MHVLSRFLSVLDFFDKIVRKVTDHLRPVAKGDVTIHIDPAVNSGHDHVADQRLEGVAVNPVILIRKDYDIAASDISLQELRLEKVSQAAVQTQIDNRLSRLLFKESLINTVGGTAPPDDNNPGTFRLP